MPWKTPQREELLLAIERYLRAAYAGGSPPAAVRTRVASITAADLGNAPLLHSPVFEIDPSEDPPARYLLRLGNRVYPHMKLVIERSPDGVGYLLRADTHDQHIRPKPGTPDAEAFAQLMNENQQIAAQIESDLEAAGLPTFKAYLKQDLARRRDRRP